MYYFDKLLEERIKFGSYQIKCILILCLIDFVDGIDLMYMSIALPIVKKEYNLQTSEVETLTSIYYFGMLFGSLSTGNIADNKGRRNCIIMASIFQMISSLSFYFVQNYHQILIARMVYGFCFGFSLPLTTSMIAEIAPLNTRGKLLIFLNFFVTLGKIYACLSAYAFIETDLQSGKWQLMIASAVIFPIIVFFGTILYILESPRFLLSKGRTKDAIQIINQMISLNNENNPQHLSNEEEFKIQNNYQINSEDTQSITQRNILQDLLETFNILKENLQILLSSNYQKLTISLWIIWFLMNFLYFGQLTIIPFIIGKQKKGINMMLSSVLGEAPAIIFSLYLVDKQGYGRKNTLTFFYASQAIIFIFCYFNQNHLSIQFFIQRFLMKNCYAMLYPYTSESYPTRFRTIGYGWANAVGRMGASSMPFILFPAFYYDEYTPFLLFGIGAVIACITSYCLPFDTQGKGIEEIEQMTSIIKEMDEI